MTEYVKKSDVLELLSLPKDLIAEYVCDLKGLWIDDDEAEQTEPSNSEIPNNCEDWQDWKDRMWAEAIVTEPTISKMEQVETMSCAECKHRPIGAEICEEPCHYEPQTDWHYDEQDATWYPYKHEDEPQHS